MSFSAPACIACEGTRDTYETSSPSMDISKASNLERFVFDMLGRDAEPDEIAVRRPTQGTRIVRSQW